MKNISRIFIAGCFLVLSASCSNSGSPESQNDTLREVLPDTLIDSTDTDTLHSDSLTDGRPRSSNEIEGQGNGGMGAGK